MTTRLAQNLYESIMKSTAHFNLQEKREVYGDLHNLLKLLLDGIDKEIEDSITPCIPPEPVRYLKYHWLKSDNGSVIVASFDEGEWSFPGSEITETPEEAGGYGYTYIGPVLGSP